ncbi:SDR family oxidoreductase [Dactylosporangium vinaceum]|uniref:SDR family NAD(P)-dependent oxidoreductase n=1 Tax=Dactylosporangium vinaceum TaxID=53362 RepID=A0ABV5M3N8_9ACTN|nr:SDR family oxidoreductase [Dactylosporangium vinaceum]UAB94413.1 SDR family oxidoreductase [Dactylosporangium vinaceum]
MRTAVVSGGTRGIGLAFSRRLKRLGYQVVALYRHDKTAADAAATAGLVPVQVDVADPVAVDAAVHDIVRIYGGPSVLVNNAGVNVDRPVLAMSVEDWRRVLDTNLSGVFYLTRALLPAMLATTGDRVIVNVGATTGIRPRRDGANYCASKAGLLQLTKCLALELAPQVRVNSLIPGNTETDELVARFGLDDPAGRAKFLADVPQGRLGTTEQVADALEFLVGPGSAQMTGQKLIVDGGQFMW